METITCANDLKTAILVLEKKQEDEKRELKEAFHETYESFKPANLIRNTISDLTSLPNGNSEILKVSVGLAVGYILKRILVGSSLNPFKLVLGNVVEFALAGYIAKNPEKFKALAINIAKLIMKARRRREEKKLTMIAIQAG